MIQLRKWLRSNNYNDIADLIDEVMLEWKDEENGTRRNWWDILAGGKNGKPSRRAGRVFPVLRAAQLRQCKPVTPNALCRNLDEQFPPKTPQARWEKHRK